MKKYLISMLVIASPVVYASQENSLELQKLQEQRKYREGLEGKLATCKQELEDLQTQKTIAQDQHLEQLIEDTKQRAKNKNRSALHIAVTDKNPKVVSALLQQQEDPNAVGSIEYTPLWGAVHNNNYQIAKLLLDAGANPYHTKNSGYSCLEYAIEKQNILMISLLLQYKQELFFEKYIARGTKALTTAVGIAQKCTLENPLSAKAKIAQAIATMILDMTKSKPTQQATTQGEKKVAQENKQEVATKENKKDHSASAPKNCPNGLKNHLAKVLRKWDTLWQSFPSLAQKKAKKAKRPIKFITVKS